MFGRWIVFDNVGQSFNINTDHPSTNGSHLLGHEGEKGAYYYYRDARPDEIPKADEKIPNETEKQTKAAAEPPVLFAAPQLTPNVVDTPVVKKVVQVAPRLILISTAPETISLFTSDKVAII